MSAGTRGRVLVVAALVLALGLVGAYLASGGLSYTPEKSQDPCKPRAFRDPEGLDEIATQFSLSALDGAACKLGVTRETLATPGHHRSRRGGAMLGAWVSTWTS